jgi:hypothetical protein
MAPAVTKKPADTLLPAGKYAHAAGTGSDQPQLQLIGRVAVSWLKIESAINAGCAPAPIRAMMSSAPSKGLARIMKPDQITAPGGRCRM